MDPVKRNKMSVLIAGFILGAMMSRPLFFVGYVVALLSAFGLGYGLCHLLR